MVTLMRHKIQSNLYADNTAVSKYKVLKLLNLLLINNSLSDISFSCTVETLVMFLGLDGIFFLSSCETFKYDTHNFDRYIQFMCKIRAIYAIIVFILTQHRLHDRCAPSNSPFGVRELPSAGRARLKIPPHMTNKYVVIIK